MRQCKCICLAVAALLTIFLPGSFQAAEWQTECEKTLAAAKKDAKNWWGGHIWEDNVSTKRHIYAFLCYTSETFWFNTAQVAPQEIRSFDDLLNPKWKGKIAFLDPRNPGSGQNTWSFLWKIKGEEYLQKLTQQDLLISQNLRQLADSLAKGKLAFTIGLSHYSYDPFIKAGLPVKPVPKIRE